jgi:SH3-like domain-containing protein
LCVFVFSAVLATAATEPFTGEIISDTINIRSDSTAGAESLHKAGAGERVEVVGESYDWYRIRLPRTVVCFIKKEFVKTDGERSGVVTAENVNIRFFPSEAALILGRADKDEPVVILGESDGWYKIEPVRNSYGWVHKKFVRKAPPGEPVPAPAAADVQPPAAADTPAPADIQIGAVIPEIPKEPVAVPRETSQEASGETAQTEDTVVLVGLVKSYGHVINRPATHKLITKDKQTYLLKYSPPALDALALHTVRVTGKPVSFPNTKFPGIEVEQIELLD